jgi:hypothetical protein
MYRIREVDGHDDEISDTLADLHRLTFFGGAPIPAFDQGNWWMVFHGTRAVAFARSCIVDARVQRGIFLPGRGAKKTLGPFAAITADARAGSSGSTKRMVLHLIRYNGQSCFGQQSDTRRIPVVPAEMSVGLAKHSLLAQDDQVTSK